MKNRRRCTAFIFIHTNHSKYIYNNIWKIYLGAKKALNMYSYQEVYRVCAAATNASITTSECVCVIEAACAKPELYYNNK